MDPKEKLRAESKEETWTEIEIALTSCLSRVSNPYGSCSITNHQYLRLISFILLHQQFHQPGMIEDWIIFGVKFCNNDLNNA